MKVHSLHIYPMKSGKGISLPSMDIESRGPKQDRLWMLIHAEGEKRGLFITQRNKGCASLAHVSARPAGTRDIRFSAPGKQELSVHYTQCTPFDGVVEIWGEHCQAIDAGDDAALWFSDYLDLPCRLIRMPEEYVRSTEPAYSKEGDQVSFADKYPVHVTVVASLDRLAEHLPSGNNVDMSRFRPNIVLTGMAAFEEDVVHEVQIGSVLFEFVKPSIRCSMTTINQEKALADSDEPLRTLGKVRKGNAHGLSGVFFGQNAIPRTFGTVHVGDPVEILSRRALHPALSGLTIGYQA